MFWSASGSYSHHICSWFRKLVPSKSRNGSLKVLRFEDVMSCLLEKPIRGYPYITLAHFEQFQIPFSPSVTKHSYKIFKKIAWIVDNCKPHSWPRGIWIASKGPCVKCSENIHELRWLIFRNPGPPVVPHRRPSSSSLIVVPSPNSIDSVQTPSPKSPKSLRGLWTSPYR